MKRRTFLNSSGPWALAAAGIGFGQETKKYRVAVIGHTGRGNFGHGLDVVWLNLPETEIVAVADGDEMGLAKAQKTLKTDNGFRDYREMLTKVKPDLVAVCTRHPDQHAAMILAAIEAGVKGVYVEKPFVRTLGEAEEIKAACQKHGAKVAVAHRNRYHPDLKIIDKILANERDMKIRRIPTPQALPVLGRHIGRLLEIRGRGKSDRRGGGEDLWVLGTHVLNLINRFGGQPLSCSAEVFQKGKPVTKAEVQDGNEALGPLAGDEIHARFAMENGVTAYWDSIVNDGTKNLGFGLQLIGSEGTVIIHCDAQPLAHFRRGNPFDPKQQSHWEVIGNHDLDVISQVQNHIVPCRDLIDSIENNREPLCGVVEAMTTIEMVMSIFRSHVSGGKTVSLPLADRNHPLSDW